MSCFETFLQAFAQGAIMMIYVLLILGAAGAVGYALQAVGII